VTLALCDLYPDIGIDPSKFKRGSCMALYPPLSLLLPVFLFSLFFILFTSPPPPPF
jgi:hypothetical protein